MDYTRRQYVYLFNRGFAVIIIGLFITNPHVCAQSRSLPQGYIEDSLRIHEIHREYWDAYTKKETRLMLDLSREAFDISAQHVSQDSFFVRSMKASNVGTAQAQCMDGHYTEWLPKFRRATEELERISRTDPYFYHIVSTSYVGLGKLYNEYGDLEKDLECQLRAQQIQEPLVKQGLLHSSWLPAKAWNLAKSYQNLGKLSLASQLLKKSIYYARLDGTKGNIFDAYRLNSLFYDSSGLQQQSLLYRDSMRLTLETFSDDSTRYIFELTYRLHDCDLLLQQQQLNQAKLALLAIQSQLISPQYNSPYVQDKKQWVDLKLSEIYLQEGNYKEAIRMNASAYEMWLTEDNEESSYALNFQIQLGNIQLSQQKWSEAKRIADQIISRFVPNWRQSRNHEMVFEKWPINKWIMIALELQVKAQFGYWNESQSDLSLREALKIAEIAQDYLKTVIISYSSDYSKSELFQQASSIYEFPLKALYQLQQKNENEAFNPQIFNIIEKSKNLQSLATINERNIVGAGTISKGILLKERALNKELSEYKNLIADCFRSSCEEEVRHGFQQKLSRLRTSHDSILQILKNDFPRFYDLKYDLDVISLSQLRRQLTNNEVVVTYYWGLESLYCMAISKEQSTIWRVNRTDKFVEAVDRFNTLVRRPSRTKEDLLEDLHAFNLLGPILYENLLWHALSSNQNISQIFVIPDGKLNFLPWACIPTYRVNTPKSFNDIPFLIRDYSLQQEYSCTVLFQSSGQPLTSVSYQGYAPNYDGVNLTNYRNLDQIQIQRIHLNNYRSEFSSLTYNVPEIQEAGSLFMDSKVFTGAEAREGTFKSSGDDAQILHLAMHAHTNDESPLLSYLAFHPESINQNEDGVLYAYELYNMPLNTNVTILSACNTGAGHFLNGQGVMSLARAFKYAGSDDVIMSHWLAHDQASYEIMTALFNHLKLGTPKAISLQKAMLAQLNKTNEGWLHPYYWAGFSLVGRGEPISITTNSFYSPFKVILIVLLALCLILFRKKLID
ncbi:MAG: CHAT domain-containing protein [Cyanobacteria bacterium J06649_11]